MTELYGYPPLAAIRYQRGFDLDRLLGEACTYLSASGARLGGVIQVATGETDGCRSTKHVMDLRTGRGFDIWEERGPCAQGCRLDERGLAEATPVVLAAIRDGVDLVCINRFGRAESRGGGFVSCIAAALEAEIPVLTAVREPHLEAWSAFHGGLGIELAPCLDAVVAWCRTRIAARIWQRTVSTEAGLLPTARGRMPA